MTLSLVSLDLQMLSNLFYETGQYNQSYSGEMTLQYYTEIHNRHDISFMYFFSKDSTEVRGGIILNKQISKQLLF